MTLEGSVAEDLYSHAKQKTCRIPHIYEYCFPSDKGNLSFATVSTKYTMELLIDLNSSKAVGKDSIPSRMLKASSPILAGLLINYCVQQSNWIDKWKESNIAPVDKKP